MKCPKCENNLFLIEIIPCCDDCTENAAWDPDECEYVTDLKIIDEKDLERNHVSEEGECEYGTAYGAGCHMFICNKCHYKTNWPAIEGC